MQLTVLGSSASYAAAGQACSGHLVRTEHARVLFDCGNGTIANLAAVMDPLTLDAVFVTHEHIDHFADVYALQALLRFAPSGPAARLPLYTPPRLFERMGAVLNAKTRGELFEAFEVHELVEGEEIVYRDLTVSPMQVDHAEPTFGLRAESGTSLLAYTADTAFGERALAVARGAGLLLAEATMPLQYEDRAPHMTARQAGMLAREAGALRLVLTHLWPTNNRELARAQAAEEFDGPVSVAIERETYGVD